MTPERSQGTYISNHGISIKPRFPQVGRGEAKFEAQLNTLAMMDDSVRFPPTYIMGKAQNGLGDQSATALLAFSVGKDVADSMSTSALLCAYDLLHFVKPLRAGEASR